jgi:transcriptional regulator with XRE-family HTH domain
VSRPDNDDRARLARELRDLRSAVGLGGIEVARRTGISQSKISKIENGLLRPSPADVAALGRVYGTPRQQLDGLVQLAESLRSELIEPRRVTLSRGAQNMQRRIRQLEASATLLRSFQPCMVIGLLQTVAYARLVFGVSSAGDGLDKAVTARMERQAALRNERTQAVLIMTEGALRWQAGSPKVMIEQLEAISLATKLPNAQVGIVPYSVSMTVFPRHGFHLYDSDAVIIGTETGTATIVDQADIAHYERLFDRVAAAACFGDEARAALSRIADDYRQL